jgi:hypothetical protein
VTDPDTAEFRKHVVAIFAFVQEHLQVNITKRQAVRARLAPLARLAETDRLRPPSRQRPGSP